MLLNTAATVEFSGFDGQDLLFILVSVDCAIFNCRTSRFTCAE